MKAIITGLGGRGKFWLGECRKHPDVEIVAWVEPEPANRRQAIEELDVPATWIFDDLGEAAQAVEADFVIDATPPAVHEEIAATAFAAGLHVLGEKPLSADFEAAKRMVEEGAKSGMKHMIAQNYRFNPLPRTTCRLLKEGLIGDLGQLDGSLYVNWADVPCSHYVREPFKFLTDMGIHHFDMMRYMLDVEPVSVRAFTWNLPWGWHKGDACQLILFKFENGLIATHRGVGCTVGYVPAGHNGEWRCEGSKGTLTWEGSALFHTHQHKANPKLRRRLELDQIESSGQNPILQEFLAALREDRQPECNAVDNLHSLAVVFAALLSVRKDREVNLSEIHPG